MKPMQVRKLWTRLNEAILVWPGEEPLVLKYNREEIWVPPRTDTARVGPGSPYRLPSASDQRGNPLRGTVLVRDVTVETDSGGYETVLDVQAMARYLVRDRDDLFNRGFNIVSVAEEVAVAMTLGIPIYEKSQDERARAIIANEMDRRRKFEEKGQPAPPSSSEHLIAWAITHLKSRSAEKPRFTTDALRVALEGRYEAEAPPATIPLDTTEGATLYADAKASGVQLTKQELAGILDGDQDQMEFVRQKIAARLAAKLEKRLDAETEARQGDPAE